MRPVSPEELSALLDGELPPDRAQQVRSAVNGNEHLRHLYEELAATDKALASLSSTAQFEPRVWLPQTSPLLGPPVFTVALGLLAVRILAKVLPQAPGFLLQGLAIALLAAWLFCRFLPALPADRWQVAHELGHSAR